MIFSFGSYVLFVTVTKSILGEKGGKRRIKLDMCKELSKLYE